jgi:hypothetical protein
MYSIMPIRLGAMSHAIRQQNYNVLGSKLVIPTPHHVAETQIAR